ncbi:hypothetical protein, partial [Herbaspirillum sp. NPDC087042]|uniref:hypothetical protein n=1 Tax=Herbaspirillum sp. NPDC087042 TaxID=3364004 RepID=UPI0038116D72
CDEQDCGLNMGQLWMQISWESGSVFNANQHTKSSFRVHPVKMLFYSKFPTSQPGPKKQIGTIC